jgi:hypothetical protein
MESGAVGLDGVGLMSFLIKLALLVTVVVFCIPADPADLARSGSAPRTVGVFDAYGLAQAVVSDAGGFCGRNPAACDTGAALGDVFTAKARTATRWVQNYLAPADHPTEAAAAPAPASVPAANALPHEATGSVAGAAVPPPPRKPLAQRQET